MVEEQCSEDNLEGTQTQLQGDTDLVLWLDGKLGVGRNLPQTHKSQTILDLSLLTLQFSTWLPFADTGPRENERTIISSLLNTD